MKAKFEPARDDTGSGRAALPVVRNFDAVLGACERRRLVVIAEKLLRDEPALCRTDVFGAGVFAGLTEAPAALFGDQREIGLHDTLAEQSLEHRVALLAACGDAIVVERDCQRFARYIARLLAIEAPQVISLGLPGPAAARPAAVRCCESAPVFHRLAAAARAARAFQVIPHIGAGSAWTLAAAIADEADVPVAVAASPPRLTRRVNDKIWFANRVRAVLGRDALPPTFAAFGPAAIAAQIARLARVCERVIVKTPNSAGSLGNVAIEAANIRNMPLTRIRRLVLAMLRARGWRGRYPLLVGVWEVDAISSPSVQLWVPARGQGDPIIEGIFEQRLAGPGAEFIGAVPAVLPASTRARLVDEALQLATLFQELGYFGRCSLDALATNGPDGQPTGIHWIECNGRWGGVSVPMTFMNRLFGNHAGRGMVIVQNTSAELAVEGFAAAKTRLGPLLLHAGGDEGVMLLSETVYARGRGVHFLATGATQARAEALARDGLARLVP